MDPIGRHTFGPEFGNYYNSGATGRFENLIWAMEIVEGIPQVIGWHITDDDYVERWRFELRDSDLFSYFESIQDGVVL